MTEIDTSHEAVEAMRGKLIRDGDYYGAANLLLALLTRAEHVENFCYRAAKAAGNHEFMCAETMPFRADLAAAITRAEKAEASTSARFQLRASEVVRLNGNLDHAALWEQWQQDLTHISNMRKALIELRATIIRLTAERDSAVEAEREAIACIADKYEAVGRIDHGVRVITIRAESPTLAQMIRSRADKPKETE